MVREVTLPWMEKLREMMSKCKTDKQIIEGLWEYGRSEEERITEEFRRKKKNGR